MISIITTSNALPKLPMTVMITIIVAQDGGRQNEASSSMGMSFKPSLKGYFKCIYKVSEPIVWVERCQAGSNGTLEMYIENI